MKILSGVLVFFLCVWPTLYAEKKSPSTHTKHSSHKKQPSSANSKQALSAKTKKELLAVFAKNEPLHKAFFAYEKQKAQIPALALEMSKAIDSVSDAKIKKLLIFSQGKLKEMKANSSREVNNQNYHLISMALIHLLNKYDLGKVYHGYACPMVKKKWVRNVSKLAKVHNPYAPNMPHCGAKN